MDHDLLTDGTSFEFWDCQTDFVKTYFIDQSHPVASDTNLGTADQPFKTINRAAELLQEGEQVIIAPGIYRECVRPKRGGNSPEAMISYEAIGAGEVIISGAEVWKTEWVPSTGWRLSQNQDSSPDHNSCIWMGELPGEVFKGYNPFGTSTATHMPFGDQYFYEYVPKGAPKREYLLRRGMLFVDNKPLEQVIFPWELSQRPGTYWIEDHGLTVHFRLWDDGSPFDHILEFTAREQCFTPFKPYQGYIRVKGLTFEKVGNGLPQPQRGALSTFCGHHWVIQDCTIRWANTIGVDIGHQSHWRYSEQPKGYHVIRGNTISDCGLCGLAGVPSPRLPEVKAPGGEFQIPSTLVENNHFERNCWHNLEHYWESAAIKIHDTQDCLIRSNLILDNGYGPAIWIDCGNINTRITSNVILGVKSTMFGAIFVEGTHHPVLIDNNVVMLVGGDPFGVVGGGHGIYEHDSDYLIIRHNLISGVSGTAIYMNLGEKSRMIDNRGASGRKINIQENILSDCGLAIVIPTPDNTTDGNIFGKFTQQAPLRIQIPDERLNLEAWRDFFGWELHGYDCSFQVALDRSTLLLILHVQSKEKRLEERIDLTKKYNMIEIVHSFSTKIDSIP